MAHTEISTCVFCNQVKEGNRFYVEVKTKHFDDNKGGKYSAYLFYCNDCGIQIPELKKKNYINWQYIEEAIENIAKQIEGKNISFISGLPRGGLIPAVMLSHKTGIPLLNDDSVYKIGEVLIVDEINDSGKTLSGYVGLGHPTATIHTKLSSVIQPTFYYEVVADDIWQVYPWENKN